MTEYFKFGDGATVASEATYTYQLAIAGEIRDVPIAEVLCDLPGLLSPEAIGMFGIQLDFAESRWRVKGGCWEPIQYTTSGHIRLPVLQYPDEAFFQADTSGSDSDSGSAVSEQEGVLRHTRTWEEPSDGSSVSGSQEEDDSSSSESSAHDFSSRYVTSTSESANSE